MPAGCLDDPANAPPQGTLRSFAVTLATWAILFALLWYGAHELFHPPADWIAALVVSFPVDAVLTAPLSGEACVYYDYEISHVPERRNNDDWASSPLSCPWPRSGIIPIGNIP